jgi:hypothetical protein
MPVEENMTLAYRFMEARVKGDLDIVDEMIAPNFVNHTNCFPAKSPAPRA